MNFSFEKKRVLVRDIEGFTDVISAVEWEFTFEKEGKTSVGAGITEFADVNTENFKQYTDVTDADIKQWVIEESFGANWSDYIAVHEEKIDIELRLDGLTEKFVADGYTSVIG